jgi:hypothetical protein
MSSRTGRFKRLVAGLAGAAIAVSFAPLLVQPAAAQPPAPPSIEDLCANVPEDSDPFTDIDNVSAEAATAIICLAFAEIVLGGPEGLPSDQYGPTLLVSRAQMSSFIARTGDTANELDTGTPGLNDIPATGPDAFVDDDGNTHEENTNRLAEADIVQGGPEGLPADQYGPTLNVSRAQMSSFIWRLIDFLGCNAPTTTEDFFTDDNDPSNPHEQNTNNLASVGIVQGGPQGTAPTLYGPSQNVSRAQMALFIARTGAYLLEQGCITPFPGEGLGDIIVTPDTPIFLFASTTPGTEGDDNALRTYTIDASGVDCASVKVALMPFTNILVNDDGTIQFTDVDADPNEADGVGETDARIESIQGINPDGDPVADGEDGPFEVDVPSDGIITVDVNGQTANEAVVLVAWCDLDDNNEINLDENDESTEPFGLGGAHLIVPAEATDLHAGSDDVFIGLGDLGVNLFTTSVTDPPFNPPTFADDPSNNDAIGGDPDTGDEGDEFTFFYDDNDDFRYEPVGPAAPDLGDISLDEFNEWISGVITGQVGGDCFPNGGCIVSPTGNRIPTGVAGVEGIVSGDHVEWVYRADEGGTSTFRIVRDIPAAPTNLVAVIGDADGDGAEDDVLLTWDGVTNPDLEGYNVFRQEVINGIPTGEWFLINTDIVEGESFNDEDAAAAASAGGGVFQYVVIAENTLGDYGPDSNLVEIDVPADETVLPLVSEIIDLNVDTDDPGTLSEDDRFRVTFNQNVALASGATIRVRDMQGDFATLTCGSNVECTVGPGDVVTFVLLADPTNVGGPGLGSVGIDFPAVIEESSGITAASSGLEWHHPASMVTEPSQAAARSAFQITGGLGPEAVINVPASLGVENFVLPLPIDDSDVGTDDDSNVVEIDEDADFASELEDNDLIEVYSFSGELLGSAPWDETVGAQINIGSALPAGTPLIVRYIANDFNFDAQTDQEDIPSQATLVFVVGDEPFIPNGGFVYFVDEDTLAIQWVVPNGPLNQVGGPATYQVFDADNTDLQATGDDVEVLDDGGQGESVVATVYVDFDNTLSNSACFTLRVAQGSVQNSDNTPNEGQVIPFCTDVQDLAPFLLINSQDEAFVTSDTSPEILGSAFVAHERDIVDVQVDAFGPDDPNTLCSSTDANLGPENEDAGVFEPLYDAADMNVIVNTCGDGEYVIVFTITDSEGASTQLVGGGIIDTSNPLVTITSAPTDANEGEAVAVDFDIDDASDGTWEAFVEGILVDSGSFSGGGDSDTANFNMPDLGITDTDGAEISVVATDEAGRVGDDTALVDVDDQDAPIITSVTAVDLNTIDITFNEATDIDTVGGINVHSNATHIQTAEGMTVVSGNGTTTIRIDLTADLDVGTYHLATEAGAYSDQDDDDNAVGTLDPASPTFNV